MSKHTIEKMLKSVSYQADDLSALIKDTYEAIGLLSPLDLSDGCRCNPSGRNWWIDTSDRLDVVKLMTLASTGVLWTKKSEGKIVIYNTVREDGVRIVIHAHDEALPPTCKVIQVEETVPAHTRMVSKVVCNQNEVNEEPV